MRTTLDIHLECNELGPGDAILTALDGREALGELFELELELTTGKPGGLSCEALVTTPATLVFARTGEVARRMHGMIADMSETFTPAAEAESGLPPVKGYRVRFVPRAFRLGVNQTLEIFMDQSVPEIVAAVLEARGFRRDVDFELRLRQSYAPREFVVQYRESDLAFVSRLCEHVGITYFFEHDGAVDRMVFSDHNGAFGAVPGDAHLELRSRDAGRGIHRLDARTRTLPARYVMRDYNYRTPQLDLTATAEVQPGGVSDVVEYGAHFKTQAEGTALARIRAEELLATRKIYRGDSAEERLGAGTTFVLEGHGAGDLELVVTEVRHRARQAGQFGTGREPPRYENELHAIERTVPFRPPRRTPRPRVEGWLTGVVDAGQKGPYAELDAEGRYRVKFLFDTSDAAGGKASRPVRMAQPHAGGGYGMHFPLRAGVEVMLSFVNGDPDRPIIASTVPNPGTPGPVTAGNATRNVIRTGGGNEINIDDTDGSQRIKMTTPHAETTLQLGSPNGPEYGGLFETAGNWTTLAQGTTSTMTAVSTGLGQLKSWLSRGSIVTEAEPPSPWSLGSSLLTETLPDIVGGIAATVTAIQDEQKTRASAAVDRAEAEATNAASGLTNVQHEAQAALATATDEFQAAKRKEVALRREIEAQEKAGQTPSPALTSAYADAGKDLDEKAATQTSARATRDALVPDPTRAALDQTVQGKINAAREKEVADRAGQSEYARQAANAAANAKTYAAAAKQLYSLWTDGLAKLNEAKALVKSLADLVEVAGKALAKPRNSLALSADPPLPVHRLGSTGVTHVNGDAYAFVTSTGTVAVNAGEQFVAVADDSVAVVAGQAIELCAMKDSVYVSAPYVDTHAQEWIVMAAGTPRELAKPDGNALRLLAKQAAALESVESTIKLAAKQNVTATSAEANVELKATKQDVKLDALERDLLLTAKRDFSAQGGDFVATLDAQNKQVLLGRKSSPGEHGLALGEAELLLGHGKKTRLTASGGSTEVKLDAAMDFKTKGSVSIACSGTATFDGGKILIG